MNKTKDSFSKQVVIVLVVAGGIILWDSFSWSKGGMNGLIINDGCFSRSFDSGANVSWEDF